MPVSGASAHSAKQKGLPRLLAGAALLAACFSLIGHVQAAIGAFLLDRFHRKCQQADKKLAERSSPAGLYSTKEVSPYHSAPPAPAWPSVSILKPLHGQEPLLEKALESFFRLDYPEYELIFGVHHADDAALSCVKRLITRYPDQTVSVIVDSTMHGPNRKISNLLNMQHACRHDILIISDSDIHVRGNYLKHIVATLHRPKTGLVTTLYAGLPGDNRLARLFGAASINANFLPGVMMSRLLGRQDCLGATMALTRQRLAEIGGFESLVNHIADDSVLGQLVARQGYNINLAPTLCLTTVSENNFRELVAHELRWGRTTRSIEPVGYGFSALQLPLFWASLSVLLAPASWAGWSVLLAGWFFRGAVTSWIARLTNCPLPGIFPLLIVRDWLSALVMLGSARGSRVAWRGQTVHITNRQTSTRTIPIRRTLTRKILNRKILNRRITVSTNSTEHHPLPSSESLSLNRSVQS